MQFQCRLYTPTQSWLYSQAETRPPGAANASYSQLPVGESIFFNTFSLFQCKLLLGFFSRSVLEVWTKTFLDFCRSNMTGCKSVGRLVCWFQTTKPISFSIYKCTQFDNYNHQILMGQIMRGHVKTIWQVGLILAIHTIGEMVPTVVLAIKSLQGDGQNICHTITMSVLIFWSLKPINYLVPD